LAVLLVAIVALKLADQLLMVDSLRYEFRWLVGGSGKFVENAAILAEQTLFG